ncbi:unnamed protein product [Trichobilharzia regenti]|nr:unnamed protein product [Trichobilharzia regenti]
MINKLLLLPKVLDNYNYNYNNNNSNYDSNNNCISMENDANNMELLLNDKNNDYSQESGTNQQKCLGKKKHIRRIVKYIPFTKNTIHSDVSRVYKVRIMKK